MGWASETSIAIEMIQAIESLNISDECKTVLYNALYKALTSEYWEYVYEALGIDPLFDAVTGLVWDDEDDEEQDS